MLRAMKGRRGFLTVGLASLAAIAARVPEAIAGFDKKTIYTRDLPSVRLNGWQGSCA
jgi:hypothetical protein